MKRGREREGEGGREGRREGREGVNIKSKREKSISTCKQRRVVSSHHYYTCQDQL